MSEHQPPVTPPARLSLPASRVRELLRQMLLIRRFEEKCAELYSASKIRGFLHLYIGEEAIAVGALSELSEEDAVLCTYREHGHALARGVSAAACMAEMYGKQEGCSRGRGGSMHLFDASLRFYGGNAIVAGHLPLAVGLGLSDLLLSRPRVTACFFGEGAAAEGEFHESLNLAALWKLPVLFICENNLYAMGTAIERSESEVHISAKARSYGMHAEEVDGMDVFAVQAAVRSAVSAIRAGHGPRLLEARTYRFRAHSMFDTELYRDKAEVERWKQHGPIHTFTDRLKAAGMLSEDEFQAMDRAALEEVEAAVRFAEAGSWEPPERLLDDVVARA